VSDEPNPRRTEGKAQRNAADTLPASREKNSAPRESAGLLAGNLPGRTG
jgi:hypothetical protein